MITTAPELIYMLKVNIGIALFYAFYKLFCCRDTFFQWRRIALLSFLALSYKCRPNIHTQSIRTCQSILFLAMDFHLSARTERR